MDKIQFQIISTDHALYSKVLALRDAVLRKPIGLSLFTESLVGEVGETIVVALSGEQIVGCVMLKSLSCKEMKLRQMAVDKRFQGLGVGKRLVREAEVFATQLGASVISLHARQAAVLFYEKCGYSAIGKVFTEVGLPHLFMKRELP